ncbi:MAG: 2-phosphosulfolactate phosphatase [Geodermatophilaceae bacterium]|jgi:2-phosphosulfolactate phosphatase|nr:2-phosphosulfolactate phosphatase [Geodermatophilaceae bacterium]
MSDPFAQAGFRLRLEWGLSGCTAITSGAQHDFVAIVDVLSFTTTLSVAADLGIQVWPYGWADSSAVAYARDRDAVLAVGRSTASARDVSLSPGTLRRANGLQRLVLPSPNGSTIARRLAEGGATVVGVSLRNAVAVADWVTVELELNPRGQLSVVAAGERWPDGSLRPAVEDLWGAGGLLAAMMDGGITDVSPEARAAAAAYRDARDDLAALLRQCASGRELLATGYPEDVDIAAEIDRSTSIPILLEGRFVNANGQSVS